MTKRLKDKGKMAVHVMSVRLPDKLYVDLKAMSQASYRTMNSLLIEFARDRTKDWKLEIASEAASARRRTRSRRDEDIDEDA